jgi:prolyl-tRNA editing enzyme YbaK/EbsC (Cys-tRNA(Pro) deacylase)
MKAPGGRLERSGHMHELAMGEAPILGSIDLERFIREHGIKAEIVHLPVETPTVDRAATAVGTAPEQIVKSLLFLVHSQPILVVARGPENVDRRAIGRHMQVGRKQVSLADPDVVLAFTGYPVGALPPFGHWKPIRTLVDRAVTDLPLLYAGGGSPRALMRLEPAELLRVCGEELVDVRAEPRAGET